MSEVSIELAKGNLSAHVKEDKNKFFGKFLWGIDMLRENLENNKEKELQLQKEKKTLILSISHDIKTPLSAIKLYAKALKNGDAIVAKAKEDGFDTLIFGESADVNFGGQDGLLSKDWTVEEYIKRFSFLDPNLVLKKPINIHEPFYRYSKKTLWKTKRILEI